LSPPLNPRYSNRIWWVTARCSDATVLEK
jgi:hypothetical protein